MTPDPRHTEALREEPQCLRQGLQADTGTKNQPGRRSLLGFAKQQRWLLRVRFIWAVAGIGLMATAHASPCVEVRLSVVQTNFRRTTLDSSTNATPARVVHRWTARCMVDRENWLIETTFMPGLLNTYFFDGTNVLQTSQVTRQIEPPEELRSLVRPRLHSGSTAKAVQSGWSFLTISPGEIPLDDLGSQLPWLAFCSGQYLRKPDRVVPLPTALARGYAATFGFKDDTVTFSDELGLPRSVRLLASAKLSKLAVKHESLVRVGKSSSEIRNAISPHATFPDGFLKGRYQVLTHTNFGGWNIPTSFMYENFSPMRTGGVMTTLTAGAGVESIKASSEPTFTLSPTARYSVADYRFRSPAKTVDQIQYAITNGQVQPVTDPALRRVFDREVAKAPFDPVIKVHYGVYVVFVALLTGPAIAAVVFWLRHRTNRKIN